MLVVQLVKFQSCPLFHPILSFVYIFMTKSTMGNSRIFKCALFSISNRKHDRSGSSVLWISASDYLKMRFAFKGFANYEVLHLK